ncbi:MAG: regulatory iron-sulfur-containing complex subunit RicT, partial [Bacteroidota bacterium]
WFSGMQQPTELEHENVYEIRFKNTRKAFYKNVNGLSLITGDMVVVESDRGYDVGQISLGGILAKLQMKKRRIQPDSDKVRKIYRRAGKEDLDKLKKARSREQETMVRTRVIVRNLNLDMKISDVEFQGDNTKAIFYYIADQRVDFRELIKILATEFRIRIEMKQIGLRHEAGLVGGIGSCGRELCCATWLTDFKSVSTSAARYQNLSLNPMKISGQCGRLKCCLNYELDTYMDALRDIPKVDRIDTESGLASLQKTDIFKRIMWFSYQNESTWIPVDVDLVTEMVAMNVDGKKPVSLRSLDGTTVVVEEEVDFVDVVGQAVLREDPRRKKKKRKGKGPRGKGQGRKPGGKDSSGNSNSKSKAQNNKNSSSRQKSQGQGQGQGKPRRQGAKSGQGGGGGKSRGGARPNSRNRKSGGGSKPSNRRGGGRSGGNNSGGDNKK